MSTSRTIGFRHRQKVSRKKDKQPELRPTQVAIEFNGTITMTALEDDTAELDFALGRYPTKYRKVQEDECLSDFLERHIKSRKLKKAEKPEDFPPNLIILKDKDTFVATKVPSKYDGLQTGDTILCLLGGTADKFVYALSRRAAELEEETELPTCVMRIPPFVFKEFREDEKNKDRDAETLLKTYKEHPELFYKTDVADREIIYIREAMDSRIDAMKARIACEQRIRQHAIGKIFCNQEGLYPEGGIEAAFDDIKANDKLYEALKREERKRNRELEKAVESSKVYRRIFEAIPGCGPAISSRLIAAIQDIRRFKRSPSLVKFCSVHVQILEKCGTRRFNRRRSGEITEGHPDARQALYLFADKLYRQTDKTEWGRKFLEIKKTLREKYPEPITIEVNGKKIIKYSNGHIHKMARWKVLTKFVKWLHREWWSMYRDDNASDTTDH